MVIPPSQHTSRTSRELTVRIDRAIREYRTDHPATSNADVHAALQSALETAAGGRGLAPAQRLALGLGLSAALAGVAIIAKGISSDGGDVTWPIMAFFIVVAMVVVFIAARRHG
jgi:hypothetical protein